MNCIEFGDCRRSHQRMRPHRPVVEQRRKLCATGLEQIKIENQAVHHGARVQGEVGSRLGGTAGQGVETHAQDTPQASHERICIGRLGAWVWKNPPVQGAQLNEEAPQGGGYGIGRRPFPSQTKQQG